MSQPLPPISSSTPPSYHFAPSESRWGFHTVVLLVGVGALGLLAYAFFSRSRSESSSDSITPPGSPEREYKPITSTFDQPHSSKMLHQGKPCLNEMKTLNFDYFAEGCFYIRLDVLFPDLTITGNAAFTVRCGLEGKEFVVHREKIKDLSPVRVFIPNMPHNQLMELTIEIEKAGKKTSKTIEQFVELKSGYYNIDKEDSCIATRLPPKIKPISHTLSPPRPIRLSSGFEIDLTIVHKIEVNELLSPFIKLRSKALTVAYLKIVHQDPVAEKEVALALPFYIENGLTLLEPSTLIECWQDVYQKATGQEAPADLKLVLSEVKFIAYLEEIDLDSSGEILFDYYEEESV